MSHSGFRTINHATLRDSASFAWNVLQTSGTGIKISKEEYANQFIRDVISHEAGHCLGLRHNFVASTNLNTAQLADDSLTELRDAARIDGCSEFRIYWDIVMPVTRPMVGAFCLISFMSAWNSFLWPQIILHSGTNFTLPIGLNTLITPQNQQYGALMAGTLLSVLPVVVLFLLLQKEFIAGLTSGAVKG